MTTGNSLVSDESQLVSVFCNVVSASILINYKCHIKNNFFTLKMLQAPHGFSTVLKVFLLITMANCNIINVQWRRGWCMLCNHPSLKPSLAQNIIAIAHVSVHLTPGIPETYILV